MFRIKMAGAIPEIDNRCGHVKKYCEGWITDAPPCFRIKVEQSELDAYMANCRIPDMTEGVAERVLVCRKIAARLATGGRFLLHSALIDYEKNGVAFVANRGVGKTTHALLWKEVFGDKVKFVNGDKPIVRKKDGNYVAYSTPWKGKEGFGEKKATTLKAVVFLERGDIPKVVKITPEDAVSMIAKQTIYPDDPSYYDEFAQNLADFVREVPMYLASVNMRAESAEVVKRAIFGDK